MKAGIRNYSSDRSIAFSRHFEKAVEQKQSSTINKLTVFQTMGWPQIFHMPSKKCPWIRILVTTMNKKDAGKATFPLLARKNLIDSGRVSREKVALNFQFFP